MKVMDSILSHRNKSSLLKISQTRNYALYEPLFFSQIEATALSFAQKIERNYSDIIEILLNYETFEVANDEIERTLDLFKNLNENKKYFAVRIGDIASFLPKYQPLYALSCFVLVPSLMATGVHFRIPHCMKFFFQDLFNLLTIKDFFPNVFVSSKERLGFLEERAAIKINEKKQETFPITEAVIFTGTSNHAEQLRLVFDKRTLFIANGSGHNPIVISKDANIKNAVNATLKLQLYNQGQDCAAPNAILVHRDIYSQFLQEIRYKISNVKVGPYKNKDCKVGPITDPSELVRLQSLLIENQRWIDESTPGLIESKNAILYPTIICKPLKEGGNYNEAFAPIFFIQVYESEAELYLYFENENYARNAMYITVYGTSPYVDSLTKKKISGKIIHDKNTILHNINLHEKGVERGTQPYGGYGYAASSLSINGKITCKPTLPQRDLYNEIVLPLVNLRKTKLKQDSIINMDKLITKDINKILRIKPAKVSNSASVKENFYIDLTKINKEKHYLFVDYKDLFILLDKPNIAFIANLSPKDISQIRLLHKYLSDRNNNDPKEIKEFIYSITKKSEYTAEQNKTVQLKFFKQIYQLLLEKDHGPRLATFFAEADRDHILRLIDV